MPVVSVLSDFDAFGMKWGAFFVAASSSVTTPKYEDGNWVLAIQSKAYSAEELERVLYVYSQQGWIDYPMSVEELWMLQEET